jgi:hypothetical protein
MMGDLEILHRKRRRFSKPDALLSSREEWRVEIKLSRVVTELALTVQQYRVPKIGTNKCMAHLHRGEQHRGAPSSACGWQR